MYFTCRKKEKKDDKERASTCGSWKQVQDEMQNQISVPT